MNHPVLNVEERKISTKGELHGLRRQGKIPAVVYGAGKEAQPIFVDAKEFQKATLGVSESTIISLNIGGATKDAFVRERQRDTISGQLLHVDFLEIFKDHVVRAKVPVAFKGTPVGVKEGGVLETPGHQIQVECLPADLPEQIEIDVSALEANHSIHVRDVPAIKNVKILTNGEEVLAVVKYMKEEVVETPAAAAPAEGAAAAGAEGAAPAEGAAGAAPAADGKAAAPGAAPAAEAKGEKKEAKK